MPKSRIVARRAAKIVLSDRSPALALKISQMRLTIAPIVHVITGKPAPDFPHTMLSLFLLTEEQLDALANYYSQVTPTALTQQYPKTMDWNQPFLDKDPALPENCRLSELERLKVKMRMFARFIGMRGAHTPRWEYEKQIEILRNKIEKSVREEEHALRKTYCGVIFSLLLSGMTIRASKLTPEVLLEAPRRSEGVPNTDASKVLYSVSTYSFSEHTKRSEIRLLDVASQQTSLVTDEKSASDPTWLDDDIILLLQSNRMELQVKYTAGSIEGPVGDLKIHALGNGEFALAVSGKAKHDGSLYNPEKAEKPPSSGKIYKSGFVRHWDHYVTETRNAIWLGKLYQQKKNGSRTFELKHGLENALKGTNLESPIDPFGGKDHFDISKYGLVFTAKDPCLNPAAHTKSNLYISASEKFWDELHLTRVPKIEKTSIKGFDGASTSPTWSNSGKMIAFLSMKTDGYESDKNQPFIIRDYKQPSQLSSIFASQDGRGKWDRSPQSIAWSPDDWQLYFTAEENGRGNLYRAGPPKSPDGKQRLPSLLVKGGTITAAQVLKNGDIFVTSTSFIENSLYSLVPISKRSNQTDVYTLANDDRPFDSIPDHLTTQYISSNTRSGSMFGLSRRQINEIHWPGAAPDTLIHAWVVKPSNFSSLKKYPLAYLIHGGPQGAWTDGWRNPLVFAEQGYVVICPNPTGSTGYGQVFVDAIQGEWGGLPYNDLVLGFDWIKQNLAYVDTARSVGLGASYGGYMMNWIQGHPLGRQFKALVTHDGVFSMTGQMASEELYFPFHDLQGPLWKNAEGWAKWDPSGFTQHWATPHLIVHSELDYRLTISEGLAAFNVLQMRGVESQFLTFPDENHWVLKPENGLMWHEVVLDWINGYVGLEKYTESRKAAKA
ncbi:dipeptidyl-peptidase 5 precursor [Cucurbitaria berberidis CBS 394.84]|uniref:Dipeptidyl-peptidase V n=1 Tax=Cucurbitaria berberidis CBS 394.84 TaxID=1168544 RepID=A0A9P4G6J9_9PLEO|nr:dipeptidyl-peptidase 5 precursor [Cucurbitaria berberidis CBS 394.84]KAF1839938.1 dipeptidyl-peptidase 5 precursor [Cucurbitaria berberidis CBS 394.84]